jgi:hypothetical protein
MTSIGSWYWLAIAQCKRKLGGRPSGLSNSDETYNNPPVLGFLLTATAPEPRRQNPFERSLVGRGVAYSTTVHPDMWMPPASTSTRSGQTPAPRASRALSPAVKVFVPDKSNPESRHWRLREIEVKPVTFSVGPWINDANASEIRPWNRRDVG